MEMNFPHLDELSGTPSVQLDFRALVSKAISRQGNSPTARLMLANSRTQMAVPANESDALDMRIRYFAASLYPIVSEAAPHGAFFPQISAEFSDGGKYDQAVYHDGLDDRKDVSLNEELSEAQAKLSGQKN